MNHHCLKDSKTCGDIYCRFGTDHNLNLNNPFFFDLPMTKVNKKDNVRYMDVEFNVSMHCNECERKIARVISKFKGVETFKTDMNSHKVVVTGKIDPKKLLKKLKKKTGKRVKIVVKEEKDEESSKDESVLVIDMEPIGLGDESVFGYNDRELEKFMWFSDENPKSICCIS